MKHIVYIEYHRHFCDIVTFEYSDDRDLFSNYLSTFKFVTLVSRHKGAGSMVLCKTEPKGTLRMYIPITQTIDLLNELFIDSLIIRTNVSIIGYKQYAIPGAYNITIPEEEIITREV